MYLQRLTHGPVDLAFTDRYGGVSAFPFDALNLARDGSDDVAARAENHRRLLADFADGDLLADLEQVHGAEVVTVGSAGLARTPAADGVVTAEPGITLMVRAADCVPVLLADPEAGVVGAAHSGRLGMVAGVVPATVRRLHALGAEVLTAWIGPYVCGACYEVPATLQTDVADLIPEAVSTTTWGTPALDIGAGVRAQLEADGVRVVDLSTCTRESQDLFSYRRDGARAGRHAGLIRVRG